MTHNKTTIATISDNVAWNMIWGPTQIPCVAPVMYTWPEAPRACSGDVHVFPCSHCAICQCGAATVTRSTRTPSHKP